jgi:hypothetical protein
MIFHPAPDVPGQESAVRSSASGLSKPRETVVSSSALNPGRPKAIDDTSESVYGPLGLQARRFCLVLQLSRPELAESSARGPGCCSRPDRQQEPPSVHTRRTSRAASAPLTPIDPYLLRESRRPWRSKRLGDVGRRSPRRDRTVLARRPVHNRRTLLASPSGEAPEHNRCRLGRTHAYTSMLHVGASTT